MVALGSRHPNQRPRQGQNFYGSRPRLDLDEQKEVSSQVWKPIQMETDFQKKKKIMRVHKGQIPDALMDDQALSNLTYKILCPRIAGHFVWVEYGIRRNFSGQTANPSLQHVLIFQSLNFSVLLI